MAWGSDTPCADTRMIHEVCYKHLEDPMDIRQIVRKARLESQLTKPVDELVESLYKIEDVLEVSMSDNVESDFVDGVYKASVEVIFRFWPKSLRRQTNLLVRACEKAMRDLNERWERTYADEVVRIDDIEVYAPTAYKQHDLKLREDVEMSDQLVRLRQEKFNDYYRNSYFVLDVKLSRTPRS